MKGKLSLIIFLIVVTSLSVWLFNWNAQNISIKKQTDLFNVESPEQYSFDIKAKMPAVGTYKLNKIFLIPRLTILDSSGQLQPISKYTKGKLTLLTFFYDRCSDANGCPYAMALFQRVKSSLERDEKLRDSTRLVHISFDPDRDTPQMMAGLEKRNASFNKKKENIEWRFLTTSSVDDLLPVVDAFGQNVDVDVSSIGDAKVLNYAHVLKAFLIDKEGYVREIYSTAYISKEMLLNDIKTLALDY